MVAEVTLPPQEDAGWWGGSSTLPGLIVSWSFHCIAGQRASTRRIQ